MNEFEKTFSKLSSEILLKRQETAVILLTMVHCYATHHLMAYNDGVRIYILMIKVKKKKIRLLFQTLTRVAITQ